MLLSINESKVAELLKSSDKRYEVSGMPVSVENLTTVTTYPMMTVVSGAIYSTPLLITEDTRVRLMELRGKIEKSGMPLENPEQLNREIDEMRGRR